MLKALSDFNGEDQGNLEGEFFTQARKQVDDTVRTTEKMLEISREDSINALNHHL